MQYIKIFLFFSIGFLFSCSNDDDKLDIKDDVTKENLAPRNFEITIKDVTHSSAKIIWNAAIDPDNDPVKYDIYLENVKIFSVVIITVLVRDRDDNMRIHLYNPNRPAGKTNATFINGIRQ